MIDRGITRRLVDCQSALQQIKASQIIAEDNYRIYTYSGTISTTAQYGAGGTIKITTETPFPLVSLENITFYVNGAQVNYTKKDFTDYSAQYYYESSDGTTYIVTPPLPQGTESANEYEFEIRVSAPSWTATNLRCDYMIKSSSPGIVEATIGSY